MKMFSNKFIEIILIFMFVFFDNYQTVISDDPIQTTEYGSAQIFGEDYKSSTDESTTGQSNDTFTTDVPTESTEFTEFTESVTEQKTNSTISTENTSKLTSTKTTVNPTLTSKTSTKTPKPKPTKPRKICNDDGRYDGCSGISVWPPAMAGESSLAPCTEGGGHAKWECMNNGSFHYLGPDFTECNDWLQDLEESKVTNIEKAIEVTEIISNKTVNDTILDGGQIVQVIKIISKVQTFVDNVTDVDLNNVRTYTSNIVDSFSNIISQKIAWNNATAHEKTNMASDILLFIQYSSFTLVCQQNDTNNFEEIKNSNIHINTFFANSSEEIVFPKNATNSSITIPPNVKIIVAENCTKCTAPNHNTAIGAVIDNIQDYLLGGIDEYKEINSDILSFSLTNKTETVKLNGHVIIKMKHKKGLEFGDKIDCAYWDFESSMWRSDGCSKVDEQSDRFQTVCKCNHLTNFAALMDVSGRESNDQLKSILTYCCGVLSIIGLILTINLILRAKHSIEINSRKGSLYEMRSIITCNLCICLLITNMLVLFGMDRTNITWLCQLSSGLLLYSLLSSFFWMLLEGNYLYKTLVSCFNSEFSRRVLYAVGYGAPVLVCIIGFTTILIKENIFAEVLFDERYSYFCWISSTHYPNHIWIVVGPALCVILFNLALMIVSIKTAFKVMRNCKSFGISSEDNSRAKLKHIISFVFISFLLGITWISFILYIHQTFDFYFSYLFIVLNGSQGFFIFLYHLSINESNSRKTSFVSSYVSSYVSKH